MAPFQEITMCTLRDKYPAYSFFATKGGNTLTSAQNFLNQLGQEGQMVLAAGVLCDQLDYRNLAMNLKNMYYRHSDAIWTERHVECGYMLLIASDSEFKSLFTRCQKIECHENEEGERWKEYEGRLLQAYQNLQYPGKPRHALFKRDLEDLLFLKNNIFDDDILSDPFKRPPKKVTRLS